MTRLEADSGRILISEPFLSDPNFTRTVILLTEHNEEGSLGFVLNQTLEVKNRYAELVNTNVIWRGLRVSSSTQSLLANAQAEEVRHTNLRLHTRRRLHGRVSHAQLPRQKMRSYEAEAVHMSLGLKNGDFCFFLD